MHVTIGDGTVEDGSIDPLEIYSLQPGVWRDAQTSGCSPADFAHVYDRIHAEQPDATILHLAYSEVTTTCFASVLENCRQGRDYVFSMDTRFVSVGQSLVVVETHQIHQETIPMPPLTNIRFHRIRSWISAVGLCPSRCLKAGSRLSNVKHFSVPICSRLSPALR